jgi:murein L,D-transpeptidase YcbB/YkuD
MAAVMATLVMASVVLAWPGQPGQARASRNGETAARIKECLEPGGRARLRRLCPTFVPARGVDDYYRRRGHAPVWVASDGPGPAARALLEHLAARRGTRTAVPVSRLECLADLSGPGHEAPARLAALDVMLSSAFVRLGLALRTNPGPHLNAATGVNPHRRRNRQEDILLALDAVATGQGLQKALQRLESPHQNYWLLKEHAARLSRLAGNGGWPEVPAGPLLRRGARGKRVEILRARLEASGDVAHSPVMRDIFDKEIEAGVRRFQERHGLAADGFLGRKTVETMNVPARERLASVLVNMERWRWLPVDWGERCVIVNVPGFTVEAFAAGEPVLKMKAVVGDPEHTTPIFSDVITYLDVNAYWNVPRSIARDELLPNIVEDPGYLREHGYEIVAGWEEDDVVRMNPWVYDWSTVEPGELNWRFRMRPGPLNPIGRIKFMFPNAYNVYLHDTPAKYLFVRDSRALSHGCVRVAKALELAGFMLEGDPEAQAALETALAEDASTVIPLKRPCMVHVVYLTAWVDEKGRLNHRPDIYGKDAPLKKILARGPARDEAPRAGPM